MTLSKVVGDLQLGDTKVPLNHLVDFVLKNKISIFGFCLACTCFL